jgi:hypothetical protein
MRLVDKRPQVSRRLLLGGGSAAIGAIVASATKIKIAAADLYEQSFSTVGVENGKTLVRLARDIYPHDRLADKYYLKAVSVYDAAAAKEPAVKALIEGGIGQLDELANKRFGKPYIEVALEADRITLLKEIEASPFFQKMRGDLVMTLYNNPEVWPQLGYEGPSAEKGGYIDRGFNDLNWL